MNRVIPWAGLVALLLTPEVEAFDDLFPLAAPADGNVFLFMDDLGGAEDNRFVAVNTGVVIEDLSTYSVTAATGWPGPFPDLPAPAAQSIQAWGTPVLGVGDIDSREFIGQEFTSTGGSWNAPPQGGWTDNEFFFVGDPTHAGQELIVLLTNFGDNTGVAYWDNFRVFKNDSLVWSDSFETGLGPNMRAPVTDAGWNQGNATVEGSGIATMVIEPPPPVESGPINANFNQITPLAAPADGDSFLYIDDQMGAADNAFVAINTGITITDLNTYSIKAATGRATGEVLAKQSIQAWSTPNTGVDDLDSREFVAQTFSTDGSWVDAEEGEWADNELFFVASPNEDGEELIVYVSNFTCCDEEPENQGIAMWDNFRVFENDVLVWPLDETDAYDETIGSFELGMAPGEEMEVADAGWVLLGARESASGIAAAGGSASLPGDFDKDGDVDGDDFLAWQQNFGATSGATQADGDGDGDGDVDGDDFLIWQANFGAASGRGATAIPEPSAVCLIGLATLLVACVRKTSGTS